MTEEKLEKLSTLYRDIIPDSEESHLFYLEILTACQGSLTQATSMINGNLGVDRNFQANKKSTYKVQKNLNFYLKNARKESHLLKIDSKQKVSRYAITLHSKEDIEDHVKYMTYHESFLPGALADTLLRYLLEKTEGIEPDQFYLFGKKTSQNVHVKPFSCNQEIVDGDLKIYYNSERKKMDHYNDALKVAQILIEDFVNEKISERDPLPFQIRSPNWKGDVVLANRYESDGSLLWHSDRMTSIGPQPVIASLTLGCCRDFNVRRSYPSDSQVYTLRPPHNSLIIMHAGFQEEYRHCVPPKSKNSSLGIHPIAKDVRINLTYRYYIPKFVKNNPACLKCRSPMELRRSFKEAANRGKYIWQCSRPYTGEECSGLRMAKFDNENLIVEDSSQVGSTWIAEDDNDANSAQLKRFGTFEGSESGMEI